MVIAALENLNRGTADEEDAPPHGGEELSMPEKGREARTTIIRLQSGAYGAFRLKLTPGERTGIWEIEKTVLAATESLDSRGKPLSEENRQRMKEIFELMKVPGHFNGNGGKHTVV